MKPLSKLTRLLAVLLKVNIGLLIMAVLADVYSWIQYSRLGPGVNANETFLASDFVSMVVGLLQFLMAIFLGVTFLRWIYRANKNLHSLSSDPMIFSPGWAVGWYFIPIANLFKPYQAMKEIWVVAQRGAAQDASLVGWWWFLWIVSNFLGRITLKLTLRANDAKSFSLSAVAQIFSDGLDIPLNVVALMLVIAIARAYERNFVEPGA